MPLSPMPCGQDRFSSRASAPEACRTRGRGEEKGSVIREPTGSPMVTQHGARGQTAAQLLARGRRSRGVRRSGLAQTGASITAITVAHGSFPEGLAPPALGLAWAQSLADWARLTQEKRCPGLATRRPGRGVSSALPAVPFPPPCTASVFTGTHLTHPGNGY